MKRTILLIALFSLALFSAKSNYTKIGDNDANYIPYYLKVYEADSLYIVGNYKRSFEILDSLFRRYEPLHQESYGEYGTYLRNKVLLNDFDNIDFVVKKAIQDFGLRVDTCLKDSLIRIAIKKANYKEQDLYRFYEIYKSKLNLDYRFAMETMIENDQRVRLAVPINKEELAKVDNANAEAIKQLIAKNGYPSIKKIGRHSFNDKRSNVNVLFLHASTEAREGYILNLMLESVKKGECEPSDFATVYDKYLWVTGKYDDKVLYGELRDPKKSLDMVVMNPQKIDSIRKSVGLENIEYRRWKIKKLTGMDINDYK